MPAFDGMNPIESEFQTTTLPDDNHALSSTASSPGTATHYPGSGQQASSPEDSLSSEETHVCDICNKAYSKLHEFT